MQNYIQHGDTLTFTLPRAVRSGELVSVGALAAVAATNYAAREAGEYKINGVFDFPAATNMVTSAGDPAYFVDGGSVAGEGDARIGVFVADKGVGTGVARVRLDGVSLAAPDPKAAKSA